MSTVITVAPFKRTGLHRLNCPALDCPGYSYATVANLETLLSRFGRLPGCACGETLEPERIELAYALGIEHPADETIRIDGEHREMSQTRALGGRQRAELRRGGYTGAVPADMHERAYTEHLERERETARARRLSGLNRGRISASDRAAAAADIPF